MLDKMIHRLSGGLRKSLTAEAMEFFDFDNIAEHESRLSAADPTAAYFEGLANGIAWGLESAGVFDVFDFADFVTSAFKAVDAYHQEGQKHGDGQQQDQGQEEPQTGPVVRTREPGNAQSKEKKSRV